MIFNLCNKWISYLCWFDVLTASERESRRCKPANQPANDSFEFTMFYKHTWNTSETLETILKNTARSSSFIHAILRRWTLHWSSNFFLVLVFGLLPRKTHLLAINECNLIGSSFFINIEQCFKVRSPVYSRHIVNNKMNTCIKIKYNTKGLLIKRRKI